MKNIVLIINSPPYQNIASEEALDFALAAAAYDFTVQVIFMGQGRYHLMPSNSHLYQCQSETIQTATNSYHCHSETIQSLLSYGIEQLYLLAEDSPKLPSLAPEAKLLSQLEFQHMMGNAQQVIHL